MCAPINVCTMVQAYRLVSWFGLWSCCIQFSYLQSSWYYIYTHHAHKKGPLIFFSYLQ